VTDLAPTRTAFGAEDRRWLRDVHGLTDTYGVTLDGSLFSSTAFPDGTVPSGTVITLVTATKLYGPYDSTASDGRQTPASGKVFLLLDTHKVATGRRVTAAGVDHGAVLRNFLPTLATAAGAIATAVETAMPRVRFTNG
jgi:hypothetical protein